jgi:hypothetical protein
MATSSLFASPFERLSCSAGLHGLRARGKAASPLVKPAPRLPEQLRQPDC